MRVLAERALRRPLPLDDDLLIGADNMAALPLLPDGCVQMAYADPPWNTGAARTHTRLAVASDAGGSRRGFGGRRYAVRSRGTRSYPDSFDDHAGFLEPRLRELHRVLRESGTLYLHVDPRVSHHCRLLLDRVFGPECFLNELVWAYDYGARTRRRWPPKHDTILVYVKDPDRYWFDSEEVDREPYMAPGLQTPERAARGKLPSSVWWHTIVPTTGAERTGYPTQKPEGVVRRMVAASSRPGDLCLDPFAGSGTLGAVCAKLGRRFVLVDESPEAVAVCEQRLAPLLAA